MIIGTAGHIDHGKTTLVRALTGVDTDRLKEEKARGISIELGYAYTPLANGEVLGIIDVPGHERFIHAMAAGACGIDFALLVVAADDGVMPQTREHLAILQLLGITSGVVAMTKVDRVDEARRAEVRAEIGHLLEPTPLAGARIFETNANMAGDPGVAALDAALREAAVHWQARRDDGLFRLSVDRVFTLAGHGTVVTGTVFAGRVASGDTLRLAPSDEPVRIRGIHAQNQPADSGHAGQRCALNLASIDKDRIHRGDWIVDPRLAQSSERLDTELTLLADAPSPLAHWAPLHVHIGTSHQVAHAALLEGETLAPGATARVQLVFEQPVCAVPGMRFVVRNAQATRTLGGGRVLDPFGPERKRRSSERHAWLDAMTAWLDEGRFEVLLEAAPLGLPHARAVHLAGTAIGEMPNAQILPGSTADDAVLILDEHRDRLAQRVLAALRSFHERSPDEAGPDSTRLRRIVAQVWPDPLWNAVLDTLIRTGVIQRSGPWLHLPGHTQDVGEDQRRLAQRLLPLVLAGGFDPPWVRDLASAAGADEEPVREALRRLAREGALYQVVRDLFYHPASIGKLAAIAGSIAGSIAGPVGGSVTGAVTQSDSDSIGDSVGDSVGSLAAHSIAGRPSRPINAAAFRDATGLGRKRAIQVLEFFDRLGYTRFHRDAHWLRGPRGTHPLEQLDPAHPVR
ncbi:selenocysteine-specific translation elongation factor [Pararobbsia alpina]|uniref:Selenocysteine-specific elongation factor n=1 Tax=Pararobbsia alpina TaxID=621374 RepID=A0A6S7B0A8_9BURK|nr:selenocysteine-specific translation elongation factor [Pararobbsia alpina]CAB3782878.1 Selenocysteine-specific elongation factor [Pararobbsia alpina]